MGNDKPCQYVYQTGSFASISHFAFVIQSTMLSFSGMVSGTLSSDMRGSSGLYGVLGN